MLATATPMPDSLPTTAATDPNADLLRRWRDQRDRAALDELAGRLMPAGWRAARAFAREHAEDVLQDAFLTLTTGAAGWRGGAVRSWFVGIVANTARDHLRRQRRRPAPLPPELPAPPEPSAPELAERVMAALLRLPEHERVPLWLNVVEGQDCGDIAVQLGRPAGTVRSQVARAFERLRGQFGGAVAVTAISTALHQQAWAAEPPAGLAVKLGDSAAVAKAVGTATIPMAVLAVAVAVTVAVASTMLLWYRPAMTPVLVAPADAMVPLPDAPPAAGVRILGAGPFQHDDDLQSIAVSPDGTRMAVGTKDGLHLWDIASGKRVLIIDTPSIDRRKLMENTPHGLVEKKGTPIHITWLPGDRLLALVKSSFFNYVGLWEADTGLLIRGLPLTALDGCQPATIDGNVLLVPGAQTGKPVKEGRWGFYRPNVLALRLDDGSELPPIVGAAPDEADRDWSVTAIAVDAGGNRVACMAVNTDCIPNGNSISLSNTGVLSVWSWPGRIKLAERRLPGLWDGNGQPRLEWLADGRLLISGGDRRERTTTIILPADLSGEESVEPGALYSAADGSFLRMQHGRASLLAANGGERTLTDWTAGRAWDAKLCWSPEAQVAWRPGRILAIAGPEHGCTPRLYDLAAGRIIAPAPATLLRRANSLVWLPDGKLLAADSSRTLLLAGETGATHILPHVMQRHGTGDTDGGRAWGWHDGKPRVLARRGANGNDGFLLLDPSSASAPRDLDLPSDYCKLAAVSPDLRWAFVASQDGTCNLLDLNDGTRAQWRHPYQDSRRNPGPQSPNSVCWVGGHLLISDSGSTSYPSDQSMTGVWSMIPFQRLHRFRQKDGSEILTSVDVVPHPDGERVLVVSNSLFDPHKTGRAWLCRIADGTCLEEIASPGGGAVWTSDGTVVTGRRAAVLLATRRPSVIFAHLHPPLARYRDETEGGAAHRSSVAIGQVQPSPSGTQVAVSAGDRLLVVDSRSGAVCATIPLGRNLVPALAAWSPGETEIALADEAGSTVLVATVAEPSADAAADRAVLADAAKPAGERRAALARLEATLRRDTTKPVLPEAGGDALLAAWLADAAQRAAPVVPPPAQPKPQAAPGGF
jgi:RNA polymerase sigma-70 factor (ECF subfamily)